MRAPKPQRPRPLYDTPWRLTDAELAAMKARWPRLSHKGKTYFLTPDQIHALVELRHG
jgi:hypothetical protein